MVLLHRVTANAMKVIKKLNSIDTWGSSPQTLLYAPEIKFYSVKAKVSKELETNIENLFAAGDGAGLSRGINVAAATGIIAAKTILAKLGKE